MGKNAKFKKLRREAKSLKDVTRKYRVMEEVDPKIIEQAVEKNPTLKDRQGDFLTKDKRYFKPTTQERPLNHYKHLKKLYQTRGEKAVDNYIKILKK